VDIRHEHNIQVVLVPYRFMHGWSHDWAMAYCGVVDGNLAIRPCCSMWTSGVFLGALCPAALEQLEMTR